MSTILSLSVFNFYMSAGKNHLSRWIAAQVSLYGLIGGFLGARIFHVLYEYPNFYLQNPTEIFKFWNGGFVYYGGLIGGFLFSAIYLKSKKQSLPLWLDLSAPVLSLGYALGRIGCLLAGCCYGKTCSLPWAIIYPPGVEAPPGIPLHPTQLYSTGLELLIYFTLITLKSKKKLYPSNLFSIWLILHGIGRIITESFRDDFRGETLFELSISTHLSLAIIWTGILLLLSTKQFKKR